MRHGRPGGNVESCRQGGSMGVQSNRSLELGLPVTKELVGTIRILGGRRARGGFKEVVLAQMPDGRSIAFKYVPTRAERREVDARLLQREINILPRISHRF